MIQMEHTVETAGTLQGGVDPVDMICGCHRDDALQLSISTATVVGSSKADVDGPVIKVPALVTKKSGIT